MKIKHTTLFCITLFAVLPLFSQNKTDSIKVNTWFGSSFEQNGKSLSVRKLIAITSDNAEAYKEMQIAKNNYTGGEVFGIIGGCVVAFSFGSALYDGSINWVMLGLGSGLILIEVPFTILFKQHATNAVNIYNSGLKKTSLKTMNLKIGLTCNGIGLKMQF